MKFRIIGTIIILAILVIAVLLNRRSGSTDNMDAPTAAPVQQQDSGFKF